MGFLLLRRGGGKGVAVVGGGFVCGKRGLVYVVSWRNGSNGGAGGRLMVHTKHSFAKTPNFGKFVLLYGWDVADLKKYNILYVASQKAEEGDGGKERRRLTYRLMLFLSERQCNNLYMPTKRNKSPSPLPIPPIAVGCKQKSIPPHTHITTPQKRKKHRHINPPPHPSIFNFLHILFPHLFIICLP